MIIFNGRRIHELEYDNYSSFILYSKCSILLNEALINIMFGVKTINPAFNCCYYLNGTIYFGLNEMVYLTSYVSNKNI